MTRLLFILIITRVCLSAGGSLPVTGEAVVLVVPDQVIVTFGIETRQPQLIASKEENDAITAKVRAAIAALLIKPEHVRADCLEIEPYYYNNQHVSGAKERMVPEYFRICRTLVVTLIDIKQIDALLTSLVTAGATQVLNVEFRTTELRKHRDEARRMAIRAAREKATLMAGELGQRIGRATSIAEGHNGWYGFNSYRSRGSNSQYNQYQNASYSAGQDAGAADTLVPPGQIAVRAMVGVTFDLE